MDTWLDANVILRYLLDDHPQHSPRARRLIAQADPQALTLKVSPHILAEVVYILEHHAYDRGRVASALIRFFRVPGVRVVEAGPVMEALLDYRERRVDFADALLMALARSRGEKVWTFNRRDFARLAGTWEEPPAMEAAPPPGPAG